MNNLKAEKRNDDVDGCDGVRSSDGVHNLYKELRHVQRKTRCTEKTILEFISTFQKYIDCPMSKNRLRAYDKEMQVRAQSII